jgi:hypothetical protein
MSLIPRAAGRLRRPGPPPARRDDARLETLPLTDAPSASAASLPLVGPAAGSWEASCAPSAALGALERSAPRVASQSSAAVQELWDVVRLTPHVGWMLRWLSEKTPEYQEPRR